VSLLVVQAGAVRESLPPDHATRPVLDSMIDGGRQAMAELRDMLSALRMDEHPAHGLASPGSAGGAAGPTPASRAPQPGLAQVADLVHGACHAGIPVDLALEVDLGEVPEALSVSGYRIVQEALTNVIKHAPGACTHVRIARGPELLELWISNDRPPDPAPRPLSSPGLGHGLIGMRERAALAGGQLRAGPTERGFCVHARLPLPGRPGGEGPAAAADRVGSVGPAGA
jgi:signal transduction histidine kinase